MLYAKEVIDLLACFPGREFRMIHIVRHVAKGRPSSIQQRDRLRRGILNVLHVLIDAGVVRRRAGRRGQPAYYAWREKCETGYLRPVKKRERLRAGQSVC